MSCILHFGNYSSWFRSFLWLPRSHFSWKKRWSREIWPIVCKNPFQSVLGSNWNLKIMDKILYSFTCCTYFLNFNFVNSNKYNVHLFFIYFQSCSSRNMINYLTDMQGIKYCEYELSFMKSSCFTLYLLCTTYSLTCKKENIFDMTIIFMCTDLSEFISICLLFCEVKIKIKNKNRNM